MMGQLKKHWPLLLLGIALLAIIILSAGLTRATIGPSEAFPLWIFSNSGETSVPDEENSPRVPLPSLSAEGRRILVVWLLIGIFVMWVITFIIRPDARKRMLSRLVIYILLIWIALWLFEEFNARLPEPPATGGDDVAIGSGSAPPPKPPLLPDAVIDPPQWLVIIITLTLFSVLLGLAWWFWQRRMRKRQEDPALLVAQEAEQAAKTIEAGSDLKDTVLRCYRDMSRVLSDHQNIRRQKAMTPREFEIHLADAGVSSEHIQRLTRLFENVRYGDTTAGEREKREALDCLNAIARTYGESTV